MTCDIHGVAPRCTTPVLRRRCALAVALASLPAAPSSTARTAVAAVAITVPVARRLPGGTSHSHGAGTLATPAAGAGAVRPPGPGPRLAISGDPVTPAMPSSTTTVGAPSMIGAGPPVASETTSFSVPGSLPCTAEKEPPTVPIFAPPILVREGALATPAAEVPLTG